MRPYIGIHWSLACICLFFGCIKGCKSHNLLIYTLVCGERALYMPNASGCLNKEDIFATILRYIMIFKLIIHTEVC